jgi:hypothetical protein
LVGTAAAVELTADCWLPLASAERVAQNQGSTKMIAKHGSSRFIQILRARCRQNISRFVAEESMSVFPAEILFTFAHFR